ncbi:hypothetical protein CL630_03750, partial [bacterium]|nr:hypothetical protein [bacterium]
MKKDKILNFEFEWELLEKCPLCAGVVLVPDGKIQWLDMDFWYNVCTGCGLKFMDPRPTQKSYQDFYKNVFWEHKTKNLGFIMQGQMWNTKRYAMYSNKTRSKREGEKILKDKHRGMRFKIISGTLTDFIRLNKKTDILEVGSGFGITLIELYKKFGSKVYAVEPSLEAQKTMRKTGNIKIIGNYAEDLEKLGKKKQKFDAIIFSHSLENTSY